MPKGFIAAAIRSATRALRRPADRGRCRERQLFPPLFACAHSARRAASVWRRARPDGQPLRASPCRVSSASRSASMRAALRRVPASLRSRSLVGGACSRPCFAFSDSRLRSLAVREIGIAERRRRGRSSCAQAGFAAASSLSLKPFSLNPRMQSGPLPSRWEGRETTPAQPIRRIGVQSPTAGSARAHPRSKCHSQTFAVTGSRRCTLCRRVCRTAPRRIFAKATIGERARAALEGNRADVASAKRSSDRTQARCSYAQHKGRQRRPPLRTPLHGAWAHDARQPVCKVQPVEIAEYPP